MTSPGAPSGVTLTRPDAGGVARPHPHELRPSTGGYGSPLKRYPTPRTVSM
jgi:hypothetical protein